nr:MAG TPA: hypothetical protein [Caudoviricetes sp.]
MPNWSIQPMNVNKIYLNKNKINRQGVMYGVY